MILELKTESKTYTTDSIDISFGTMEDIINVLDFENLMGKRRLLPPSPWQRLLVFDRCGISKSRSRKNGLPVR